MTSEKEQEVIKKAHKCWKEGHFSDAFTLLKGIVDKKFQEIVPLLKQMAAITIEGGANRDALNIFGLLVFLEPKDETASLGLFHSRWDAGMYEAAVSEIDRYTSHSSSNCYEDIAATLIKTLSDDGTQSSPSDVSAPSTDSRISRGLKPRWDASRNPVDQLDGLERKQRQIRKGKNKGVIDSIEKSKQRLKQDLDRIKSPDDIDTAGISQSTLQE